MRREPLAYRCGAEVEVLIPEGVLPARGEEAVSRKRAELLAQDCPHCRGVREAQGWTLDGLTLWQWREVGPDGRRRH